MTSDIAESIRLNPRTMGPLSTGTLPGRVTTGRWTEFRFDRPTLLQPTWSPVNTEPASLAIINEPTFIPTLYWTTHEGFSNVDPNSAPLNQHDLLYSHAGGRLHLPPGRVYVCNPNPSTLPVPYVFVDEDATEALMLEHVNFNAPQGYQGTRTVQQGPAVPAPAGLPGSIVMSWDAYRVTAMFGNVSNESVLIGIGSNVPITNGGVLVARATNVTSPTPWAMHRAVTTAGALLAGAGFTTLQVTR